MGPSVLRQTHHQEIQRARQRSNVANHVAYHLQTLGPSACSGEVDRLPRQLQDLFCTHQP